MWLTSTEPILIHSSYPDAIGIYFLQDSGDSPHQYTGKNDLMRRVTHREAVFGPVIHSIFDAWHYEVLWSCELTRLL